MKRLFQTLTAALVLGTFVSVESAAAEPAATVRVEVTGLRNTTGQVGCLLFNAPKGFPEDYSLAYRQVIAPITGTQATCEFKDAPPGTYAFIVLHDENMNGKMDKNFFGIPTEGYVASNNVRHAMSAPEFTESSFAVKAGALTNMKAQVGY